MIVLSRFAFELMEDFWFGFGAENWFSFGADVINFRFLRRKFHCKDREKIQDLWHAR
jgi:hypothetical protein